MAEDGLQKERSSEADFPTYDAPFTEETHDRIPFTGVCDNVY